MLQRLKKRMVRPRIVALFDKSTTYAGCGVLDTHCSETIIPAAPRTFPSPAEGLG